MAYVASPRYGRGEEARTSNLHQCLDPARKRLDEMSNASDAEKCEEIVSGAVEAGWDEEEVRQALSDTSDNTAPVEPRATFGIIPSSSM